LLAKLSGLVAGALLALALLVELLAAAERGWLATRLGQVLGVLRAAGGEARPAAVAGGDEVGDLARRSNAAARQVAAESYVFASWVEEVRASQIDPLAQARIDQVRDGLALDRPTAPQTAQSTPQATAGFGPRAVLFLALTAEIATWTFWAEHDLGLSLTRIHGIPAQPLVVAGGLLVAVALLGLLAVAKWRCSPGPLAALLLIAALANALAPPRSGMLSCCC
jgi:hypothetical protein